MRSGIRYDGGARVVGLRFLAYGPAALVDGLCVTLTLGFLSPRLSDRLLRRAIEAALGA